VEIRAEKEEKRGKDIWVLPLWGWDGFYIEVNKQMFLLCKGAGGVLKYREKTVNSPSGKSV